MPVFTFHLARSGLTTTARALARPPTADSSGGLEHAECLTVMELGLPVFSPERLRPERLAMLARWENEQAIDRFLDTTGLGQTLAAGWHVRLDLLRRWGRVSEFEDAPELAAPHDSRAPVVAITLARLRHTQLARFIRWGKPAEQLVRDHPGTAFAVAASRPPRTVATFSIWRTASDMIDMVHGHSVAVPEPRRHAAAMVERERKDFHVEFTTLRFRPVSEHGQWEGRSGIIPARDTGPSNGGVGRR